MPSDGSKGATLAYSPVELRQTLRFLCRYPPWDSHLPSCPCKFVPELKNPFREKDVNG